MNYPIEKLNDRNLADVSAIGYAFVNEVNHPGGFSYEAFERHWSPTLTFRIGEIFAIRDNGKVVAILGCAFVPECFSGLLTACEQFWYVLPEYRNAGLASQLFDAFEAEAKHRGCKKLIMAHLETPEAEKLHALYLKRGYRPVEKTFGKEI
jgi:GNAT superfamily N-acetyltransferase